MLDRSLEDTLPYLFALLGIEEQPSPLQQMDPQIRRRRTFEALKKLFLRESLNQPLILIFEDLHWIDSETQGFLDVLSESVASAKLLLLTNYRPEYRHEWGQKTYYTQLRLAPFGKAEAEEFLDALLGDCRGRPTCRPRDRATHGAPLHALKHLILEKTEGTPFFMEEIVQELVEQGVLVRDAVGAGLATCPPRAQQAAPLRPSYPHHRARRPGRPHRPPRARRESLAATARGHWPGVPTESDPPGHHPTRRRTVSPAFLPPAQRVSLRTAGVSRSGVHLQACPDAGSGLRHGAAGAAQSLARAARRRRLEALYRANLDEHYSDLAHHYSRSGNTEKAVEYLSLAGQQAVQQSANAEAITHLTTALELLKTLPDTAARARQELTLHLSLGASLMATKGYGAAEVEQTYTRAQELCLQVGEPLQVAQVLFGLWAFYVVRGNHTAALALGEQFLTVAHRQQDATLSLVVHAVLGATLLWRRRVRPRASAS